MTRSLLAAACAAIACLALSAPAFAAPDCSGTMTRTLTAPSTGWVTAKLDGAGGSDWDLSILDRRTGRLVAGSSSFTADEVAEGLAVKGTSLRVQACHLSGAG